MEFYKEIERSIITNYRKEIWRPFMKAITTYKMIDENDKIAVCISGGKDSFLLAKCMQELMRHGKKKISLVFLVMNPGYKKENYDLIYENAKKLDIPITMFDTDIFDTVFNIDEGNPCYLCARMRRGNLYKQAKELGCNKIALAHHFDDVIETILMSTLYSGEFKTMMPKLHSSNFKGMELIRPLYLVREKDIISWKNKFNLNFLNCACRFTENACSNPDVSTRKYIKNLIKDLKQKNPYVEKNIFKSVENVNLRTIISYKKDGQVIHFLDNYDE